MTLQEQLNAFIQDPFNPLINFNLGWLYEQQGQSASAMGYYIRTAEFGDEDILTYEALLRTALCLQRQGSRVFTTKGILLRAIALKPALPEAYFLLSRLYEISKDWQEGYTFAELGENLPQSEQMEYKLKTDVEYPGNYGFMFEKAVTGWWIGLWDESIYLFRKLERMKIEPMYSNSVKNNLLNLANNNKPPIVYEEDFYPKLHIKFPGAERIKQNYSQCYQDMFVLTMLNGKRDGFYVEIGAGDPLYGNNTALFSKEFGWDGLSVDIDKSKPTLWEEKRKGDVIYCEDATKVIWMDLIKEYAGASFAIFDYLQIDCDPPQVTLAVLKRIPFHSLKFAVITFEHDYYTDPNSGVREESRRYLESFGYVLVAGDIAPDKYNAFEDWWVHPDLVNKDIIDKMQVGYSNPYEPHPIRADDYMFGKV